MEPFDGLLERVAADKPHCVIRASIAISAQSVDWDYPRMLDRPGNLCFNSEPSATAQVVGMLLDDLL